MWYMNSHLHFCWGSMDPYHLLPSLCAKCLSSLSWVYPDKLESNVAMMGVGSQTYTEKTVGLARAEARSFSLPLVFSEMEQGLWAFGSLFRQGVPLVQWDVASGRARGVWTLSVT